MSFIGSDIGNRCLNHEVFDMFYVRTVVTQIYIILLRLAVGYSPCQIQVAGNSPRRDGVDVKNSPTPFGPTSNT